jgi:hypothetical protein
LSGRRSDMVDYYYDPSVARSGGYLKPNPNQGGKNHPEENSYEANPYQRR